MNYFIDLIAKSYLNNHNDSDIEIALYFFNEFLKVRPGVKGDVQFSKDYFYKKLISNIDLLIDDSYAKYSDPIFDPSVMDYESYEFELNSRQEIIEEELQNEILFKEFNKENPINWDECEDAEKLTYALKYKGVLLSDPIIIIKIDDKDRIVLRKSNLEFLKIEAERANISTINKDHDYLFDESSYLKILEDKSNQGNPELNLKNNDVIDEVNLEATQILNEKMDNISREIESYNTSKPQSEFLTAKEAAEFLNLSINTIYSKTSNNEIPYMKKGKNLIFSRVQLIEYVKSGKVKTKSDIEAEADNFIPKSKK